MMTVDGRRIQRDRPLELPLGSCPVSIKVSRHERRRDMRVREGVVYLQRHRGRHLCERVRFCRSERHAGQFRVDHRKACVRERVMTIQFDRLLEILSCNEPALLSKSVSCTATL